MSLVFDVTTDIKQVADKLIKKHRQEIPFAASQALNSTIFRVQKLEKLKAKKEIDRPIPFTMRGFRVRKATKNKLESMMYIAPIQWSYLQHIIVQRSTRRAKGKFIGVPYPKNTRFNEYGNVIGKKKGLKGPNMFFGTIKGIHGIWERGRVADKGKYAGKFSSRRKTGTSTVRLRYGLYSETKYMRTFDYFGHAERSIKAWFRKDLDRELAKAIKSGANRK